MRNTRRMQGDSNGYLVHMLYVYLSWYQNYASGEIEDVVLYWKDVEPGRRSSIARRMTWPKCQHIMHDGNEANEFSELYPNFSGRLEISGRGEQLTDQGLWNFSRVRSLKIGACEDANLSNSSFSVLCNLTHLDMRRFNHSWITDEVFLHLTNVRHLTMKQCSQLNLSDFAFQHLSNLTSLDITGCNQSTITDGAFRHLRNLRDLNISQCNQTTISDEAFKHLEKLEYLTMDECDQSTITPMAFTHLSSLAAVETGERHLFEHCELFGGVS
eukprot:gb/GECG01005016.1/.p1 GENE.gb/GECG01005016.1/~~gb/GECG01005016.1/.p1  ORF type:complete len:271 (+),score=16.41 gb/GECG01005016.1/:1-813(+)